MGMNELITHGLIGVGGGGSEPSPDQGTVTFYDFDGTPLHSYTVEEAQGLEALPTGPDHSSHNPPLTFQEWNYTLAEVQGAVRSMDVGATVIPADGKTHIVFDIVSPYSKTVSLRFNQSASEGIEIDWGDGTSKERISGTGNQAPTHEYPNVGTYTIKVESLAGTWRFNTSSSTNALGTTASGDGIGVREVYLGQGMTQLYTYALSRMPLTKLTIPTNITTFGANCVAYNNLKCAVIPKGTETMPNYMLAYGYLMEIVSMPEGVASIGTCLVGNTNSTKRLSTFQSIVIPGTVTGIGDHAFSYTNLKAIHLPHGVRTIGNSAFAGTLLRDIIVPSSCNSMGAGVFSSCSQLVSADIKAVGGTLPNQTFESCQALTKITLPSNLHTIGNSAFAGCVSLGSIVIPNTVTNVGNSVFSSCEQLESVSFPANMSSIGGEVFRYCSNLSSVVMPDISNLTGDYHFEDCNRLSSVPFIGNQTTVPRTYITTPLVTYLEVPEGIISLGITSLSNLPNLRVLHLPSTLSSMANQALSSTPNLHILKMGSTSPPTITSNSLQNLGANCTILVPSASLSAYQSATYWSAHAAKMVGI